MPTGRRSTPTRTGFSGVMQRRKPAKPSGMRGALNSVMSSLPFGSGAGKRRSSSSGRGKAGAGIALATAAAGLAAANRDKLTALLNRDKDSTPESMPAPTVTVTPPATEPGGPADAAGDATPPPRP